jgi:NADH-quinone oxidoreductase subunit C/D
VRVRPPCFPLFASYPALIEGEMIADAIATLGTLNIVVGELDR